MDRDYGYQSAFVQEWVIWIFRGTPYEFKLVRAQHQDLNGIASS